MNKLLLSSRNNISSPFIFHVISYHQFRVYIHTSCFLKVKLDFPNIVPNVKQNYFIFYSPSQTKYTIFDAVLRSGRNLFPDACQVSYLNSDMIICIGSWENVYSHNSRVKQHFYFKMEPKDARTCSIPRYVFKAVNY